jgi:hypothetical protein
VYKHFYIGNRFPGPAVRNGSGNLRRKGKSTHAEAQDGANTFQSQVNPHTMYIKQAGFGSGSESVSKKNNLALLSITSAVPESSCVMIP